MHAIRNDRDTADDMFAGAALYCPTCGDGFSPMCERCPDDDSVLVPRALNGDPLIGRALDARYRVLRLLAQGSMGNVYEGVQLPNKRPVAIKVIRDELGHDPASSHRFLREARLLTRIAHPNIVDVLDYGETPDGRLYLVMDLLRGKTLDKILDEVGPFSVRRTCEVGIQLCSALISAHAHGVTHRDLKPANIFLLVELGDWVKVLDFGLAKAAGDPAGEVTYAGAVLGTPLYMAPETISYNIAEPRSDLYALGCILHEMLTGMPPFYGESTALVLARHLDDSPPLLPGHLPATLRKLIDALLAKNPDHRPANALTVCAVLEHVLAGELVADLPTLIGAALPDRDENS
jgi:serine/threonine-protein kinase